MLNRIVFKIAVSCLLLLGAVTTASLITPPPRQYKGIYPDPCSQAGVSRYEAWVKQVPCVTGMAPVPPSAPSLGSSKLPGEINSPLEVKDYVYLVFNSYRDGNWEIYGTYPPWNQSGYGTPYRMTNDPGVDLWPRLRPGTTQVLFGSNRTGNYELYLMNWNGVILNQLTNSNSYDAQGAWSPDGNKIAFVSDRGGNLDIYTMLPDGSGTTRLTTDSSDDFNPAWSADGTKLFWIRAVNQEYGVLFTMNADGSNPHPLTGLIRYLENPSPARVGNLLAFDCDWNKDGWMDLAIMNEDGNNLKILAYGSEASLLDFIAGSTPMIFRNEVVFTWIQYWIDNDGRLKIFRTSIGAYNLNELGYRLYGPSELDFYPDTALIDITPPETHVLPMLQYQRAGSIPVTVVGTYTGPAEIQYMELQYRLGQNGEWQNVGFSPLHDFTHTFTFNAQAGTTIYFRSRGRDWADNVEAWPPGDGDTFTIPYAWQLSGRVTDDRGNTIPKAQVISTPAFEDQTGANNSGQFHRYVPTSPVTITVAQAGYGVLPPTSLSGPGDTQYQWVMPPQENHLINGDFEQGLGSWSQAGTCFTALDTNLKHTGNASAALSRPAINPVITDITHNLAYSSNPRALSDDKGIIHLIWAASPDYLHTNIYYSSEDITGTWTSPILVNPNHVNGSGNPEIALGKDGTLHAVWFDYGTNGSSNAYYAFRTPDGSWSQPSDISGSVILWDRNEPGRPDVAVDSQNTVHVVWADQDGLWYRNKPETGGWIAPAKISNAFGPHAITVDPQDTVHFVFTAQGLVHISRSVNGIWSSPETINQSYAYDLEVAADSLNRLHLAWVYNGDVFYENRSDLGQWSGPTLLSKNVDVNRIEMTVEDNYAHIIWPLDQRIAYRRQFQGDIWSPLMTIPTGTPSYGWSVDVIHDHIQAFWSILIVPQVDIMTAEWDLPQRTSCSISQALVLPDNLNKPTLSFLSFVQKVGDGGLLSVKINNTLVYTSSLATTDWAHSWIDLSAWTGRIVTATVTVENDLAQGILTANLDDITAGAWNTPLVSIVEPDHMEAWVSNTITITGENFLPGLTVRLDDLAQFGVERLDEHTIRIVSPTGFAPGFHDVWVINPGGQAGVKPLAVRVGKFLYLPVAQK